MDGDGDVLAADLVAGQGMQEVPLRRLERCVAAAVELQAAAGMPLAFCQWKQSSGAAVAPLLVEWRAWQTIT